jgi:multiple sugar transport system substrate-binding protein
MFKRIVSGILLTLLVLGMSMLAFDIQPVKADVELTVFSLWGGTEEQNFLQVLANFTEQTGITVNHIGFSAFGLQSVVETELSTHISSADVIISPWPVWILDLASREHLIEATNLINASKYPTNIVALVTDGEGRIYAAPFKLSAKPGFWYKKSFFTNHRLTIPTTFDEFNNTLLHAIQATPGIEQAIASGDMVGWPLSDTAEAYIMGLGGYQLQEDLITGPCVRNWTDVEVVDVFEQLRRELATGYFSPPTEWTSQITKFWDEKYGLYFMGSWMTNMPQIGNLSDLDFFGFPGTDGVAGAVDYAFIPKYTEHLDEAELLFQYLAGAEAQETMVKLGFLAPNMEVPADAYRPIDKKIVDFISQPSIHMVPDLDDAIGGNFQTTFWDQLKLLWVDPTTEATNDVLETLQEVALQQQPCPPLEITATVEFHPYALNLRSKGRWITAYIELPEGSHVSDINVSSIRLNDTVSAELRPRAIGDYNEDGILDLMVKFDRAEVISYILSHINMEERFMTITLTITGYLDDGALFQGSDTVRIMMPMPRGAGRHIFRR